MIYEHWKLIPEADWRWKNFSPQEVACRHCGRIIVNEDFLDKVQAMRDAMGHPLIFSSMYRCSVHNAQIGGAPLSMHLLGRAGDLPLRDHLRRYLESHAVKAGFTGFGYYKTFLHIDTGRPRWWGEHKDLWT